MDEVMKRELLVSDPVTPSPRHLVTPVRSILARSTRTIAQGMPDISLDLALVLIAAFGAGLIDAMVGGGGLVQLPALFAFYPNVAPPALLGTSKLAGIFG